MVTISKAATVLNSYDLQKLPIVANVIARNDYILLWEVSMSKKQSSDKWWNSNLSNAYKQNWVKRVINQFKNQFVSINWLLGVVIIVLYFKSIDFRNHLCDNTFVCLSFPMYF